MYTKAQRLQNARLPKMLGELTHSNQFLKIFSIFSLVLVFMGLGAIMVLATKEPLILTLGPDGKALERQMLPKAEIQISEAIKSYLDKRYAWEPSNVRTKFKKSEDFISPLTLKAYQGALLPIAKFSREKTVSQRVYPESIKIDLNRKVAFISGDRITSIQGFKAAGNLRLELSFDYGPRTLQNPWGIYITKEREE